MPAETAPLRFAVLHHTAWPGQPDHYDLMLQTAPGLDDDDRVLMAFSTVLDIFPDGLSSNKLTLNQPHRRCYLLREGPIEGGRGIVKRVEKGEILKLGADSHNEHLILELNGTIIKGLFALDLGENGKYLFEKLS